MVKITVLTADSQKHVAKDGLRNAKEYLRSHGFRNVDTVSSEMNPAEVISEDFADGTDLIVAGGGYQHQAHTVLEEPTPLCNLYLELLQKHNIDAGGFGSSTESLGLLGG